MSLIAMVSQIQVSLHNGVPIEPPSGQQGSKIPGHSSEVFRFMDLEEITY